MAWNEERQLLNSLGFPRRPWPHTLEWGGCRCFPSLPTPLVSSLEQGFALPSKGSSCAASRAPASVSLLRMPSHQAELGLSAPLTCHLSGS